MTYKVNNRFKNFMPFFILILIIIILTMLLKDKVLANEFKLQRRDIQVLKEEISISVSDNKIDAREHCSDNEEIDGINWYIEDDTLHIEKTSEGKIGIKFENYYDCPWNKFDYCEVKIDGGIGVRLWYFNKGKARKCGKI